MTVFSTSSLYT